MYTFTRGLNRTIRHVHFTAKSQRNVLGSVARFCTASDLSKISDMELFHKSAGIMPKIEAIADILFEKDSQRFDNIMKNGVAPEASFPVRLYLYTKLKHLLLEKYHFDEAEFMQGARGSIDMLLDNIIYVAQKLLQTPESAHYRTEALKNFNQFEKDITRQIMALPEVEALSAFVSPRALKQYSEMIIAGVLQKMNKFELYGCSLLTVKVHLANEYTDALKVIPYDEKVSSKPPVVLVDATVGLAFRMYHTGSEEKYKDIRNSAMWTFRAPISDEEYDWRIVHMPCMIEP